MVMLKRVPLEEELKKNPELKKDDVQALIEWHKKQPHLPPISDSDFALFLHSNYYRIESTKVSIDNFYTVRTHVTELFTNRDIEKDKGLKQSIKTIVNFPLAQLSNDGYGIIFAGLADFEPSHYEYNPAVKLLLMVMDLWMYQLGTVKGHVMVLELKGLALGHASRINLGTFKKFVYYLQEALPVRFKAIHFINANPVMDLIMNMIKPFMNKELMDLIHVHQKVDTLENFNIPVDVLPNESGGKAGSQKQLFDEQLKKLKDHRDWFLYDEKNQRVNEGRRPGKAKSATDLFGIEGSFKKLELD